MRKPFYGWVIVGVAFLIGATEAGAFQSVLAIFMKPMVLEFGWSRASVTGSIAFGSICAGLLSPFVGPVLDRYGPRMVAFWGVFFLSLGLVAMTTISRTWQLYLFFGVGRMLAVGPLTLVVSVSIPNWFVRQRGRAMGISWLGPRFGSAVLPLLIQFFILVQGWRMAWTSLGVVIFLMSGLPALFFLRRRPEDMGLLPDGALAVSAQGGSETPLTADRPVNASGVDSEPAWSSDQARRTKAFWVLTLLHSLIPFLQAGINFHIYPFMTDQGLSEVSAVLILSTVAVSGALGSVTWGLFAERFRIQSLLAVNIFINGLAFLWLYWTVKLKAGGILGTGMIFFLAAVHGGMHGGRQPLLDLIWASFFGRRSLGSIYSLSNPFRWTANAVGPLFAAFCFDLFGSYAFPFYLFTLLYFVSAAISLVMKAPGLPSGVVKH